MNISQRQFTHLHEMGITLWQRRVFPTATTTPIATEKTAVKQRSTNITINLTDLSTQQIFSDILLSINLTLADIKTRNAYLDLGLLNWQFTETTAITLIENALSENTLSTPNLNHIAQSTTLKRQLWQLLQAQQTPDKTA
ncbi:MAG: hypothetical protein COB35_02210 [Gammaproteobacteria bacterium]|nr:MAG: hypothetical protein COB35_02210 [Gammaproteobacteria bacterium]